MFFAHDICTFSGELACSLSVPFNPFTAVLASWSLEKRPIKVPDLKSLWPFPPSTHSHKKTSIKMHSI